LNINKTKKLNCLSFFLKGLSPEWMAMIKEAGLGKEDILKDPKQMIDVINTYNEGIEVVDNLPSQSQV
jgi:hypothetical protein